MEYKNLYKVAIEAASPGTQTGSICRVCQADSTTSLYRGLLKCSRCGFVWADCSLSSAELVELYSRNYFMGGEYRNYLEDRVALEKDFTRQLRILLPFVNGGKLYELGSAYGFFLNLAKPKFEEVSGIDLNAEACSFARSQFSLNVSCGDFIDTDIRENYYDVVCSWATIEHLQTPDIYIEKINKILKIGGYFALTTGDIDALLPSIRKSKWRLIHPPTHLSYFSKSTLNLLLRRCGFEPVYASYIGQSRTIDSVLYSIFVLLQDRPEIYQWAKRRGLTGGSFYMNTFDIIYFIAKKTR